MAGKYLIELTDPRFLIPANEDVMAFVRRANPSAHSDVGDVLFALRKQIPGAHAYCPLPTSYAYVVLHTDSNRIFAIAYGMRGLAIRLAAPARMEAVADSGTLVPNIGPDWVGLVPWDRPGESGAHERLLRWGGRAFEEAMAEPSS